MKNSNFFEKKFESLSTARKINLVTTLICSIALASSIASVWAYGGCEFIICLLGGIMGFLFPAALGCWLDEYLAH